MRNPKWHRDEIILALDLYFSPNRGSVEARNPNVIQLSELLNKLPLFAIKPDEERFRNPNGVSLKLSNFLAIDPAYPGKGMHSYSKLDKEIFEEFMNDRELLRVIAEQIKKVISNETLKQQLTQIEDDEATLNDSVQEGRVLYKLHKYKERNQKIVAAKKKSVLKTTGRLACEVCDLDFYEKYGDIGLGYIECHHIKPLTSYNESSVTKMNDLAVVCANCHRMLHRRINDLTIKELRIQIKNEAMGSKLNIPIYQ